jgi:hypothetical protein
MAHTSCMLDKQGYTHARANTHRKIVNIYCISTATVIPLKRLSVTLYAHCLSVCLVYLALCAVILHCVAFLRRSRRAGGGGARQRNVILTRIFCEFLWPLLANSVRLTHNRFLPHPFQFYFFTNYPVIPAMKSQPGVHKFWTPGRHSEFFFYVGAYYFRSLLLFLFYLTILLPRIL